MIQQQIMLAAALTELVAEKAKVTDAHEKIQAEQAKALRDISNALDAGEEKPPAQRLTRLRLDRDEFAEQCSRLEREGSILKNARDTALTALEKQKEVRLEAEKLAEKLQTGLYTLQDRRLHLLQQFESFLRDIDDGQTGSTSSDEQLETPDGSQLEERFETLLRRLETPRGDWRALKQRYDTLGGQLASAQGAMKGLERSKKESFARIEGVE